MVGIKPRGGGGGGAEGSGRRDVEKTTVLCMQQPTNSHILQRYRRQDKEGHGTNTESDCLQFVFVDLLLLAKRISDAGHEVYLGLDVS